MDYSKLAFVAQEIEDLVNAKEVQLKGAASEPFKSQTQVDIFNLRRWAKDIRDAVK